MALTRMSIDGYGQLELNQVAFRRDGRIEAQCALDSTDFESVPAENGMLLAVNNVKRIVKFPDAGETYPIALNYTTEHMYDERKNGLKDFALPLDSFLPRLGYLATGDKFTTNCVCFDNGSSDGTHFTAESDLLTALSGDLDTNALYGQPCEIGAIKITKDAPTSGVSLRVIAYTTMPDGQKAVKFQAL